MTLYLRQSATLILHPEIATFINKKLVITGMGKMRR